MNFQHYSSLHVRKRPNGLSHFGIIDLGVKSIPCILGKNGITRFKRESDISTPAGEWRLLFGYYRTDRVKLPPTALPMMPIASDDGWCDEPGNPNYNCPVKLPFNGRHEKLHREDRLYDVCIVLDYNITPQIQGRGSAIFFHLTSGDCRPTAGCIAIDPCDMLKILPQISNRTVLSIE